jgi:hypothetical protein
MILIQIVEKEAKKTTEVFHRTMNACVVILTGTFFIKLKPSNVKTFKEYLKALSIRKYSLCRRFYLCAYQRVLIPYSNSKS